jgi:hypothetical protein
MCGMQEIHANRSAGKHLLDFRHLMAFDRTQHYRHDAGREGKPGPFFFKAYGGGVRNGFLHPVEQNLADPRPRIPFNQDEAPGSQATVVGDMHGLGQERQQASAVRSWCG